MMGVPMTEPHRLRKYEAVDWHGMNLRIDQDEKGYVSISHPPFETHFNSDEMKEISQFIHRYVDEPTTSADKVLDELPNMSSTDLLLLAHDEWKRREERKNNHPEDHWVSGFINGFLTDKKWAREYVKKLRQEREP